MLSTNPPMLMEGLYAVKQQHCARCQPQQWCMLLWGKAQWATKLERTKVHNPLFIIIIIFIIFLLTLLHPFAHRSLATPQHTPLFYLRLQNKRPATNTGDEKTNQNNTVSLNQYTRTSREEKKHPTLCSSVWCCDGGDDDACILCDLVVSVNIVNNSVVAKKDERMNRKDWRWPGW